MISFRTHQIAVVMSATLLAASSMSNAAPVGQIEEVIALSARPGNVVASRSGRVFSSLHSADKPLVQFVEIKNGKAVPYPSSALQKNGNVATDATFDSPMGVFFDHKDDLWVIDAGHDLGKTRIWHIDIRKNRVVDTFDVPVALAPKGSYVQEIVVDEKHGWAFLSDVANPGVIAVDLKTRQARRFSGHPSEQAENIDMVIDGKVVAFQGKPARIGMGPMTISADRETLFYGSMNGSTWYAVPTSVFRERKDDAAIGAAVRPVGPHPLTDGASIDSAGNHYFTNLPGKAVTRLGRDGKLVDVVKDERLDWLDNASVSPDDRWLYISANQLHKSTAFTGRADEGVPPFHIYRARLK